MSAKKKSPSTKEIHGYTSYVGRTPSRTRKSKESLPPVVETKKDMDKVLKAVKGIKQMLLAITAQWCGACQRIKKQLHTALRNNSSNMPATNIDDSMLSQLKGKNSIDPPHFPYFVVVDKNLKVLKVLNGVEDVIAMLQSSGISNASLSASNSASVSTQPSASVSTQPSASVSNSANSSDSESLSFPSPTALVQSSTNSANTANSVNSASLSAPSSKVSTNSTKSKLVSINNEEEEEEEEVPEMGAVSIIPNANGRPASVNVSPVNSTSVPGVGKNNSLAVPPIAKNDQASTSNTRSSVPSIGGSLYGSLASTAYQLAPPAILMGIAAATLQKRSRKRKARKSKTTRRRR